MAISCKYLFYFISCSTLIRYIEGSGIYIGDLDFVKVEIKYNK